MEDGDAAEGARLPFGMVGLELGVNRLEEGAEKGDLEGRSDDGALLELV